MAPLRQNWLLDERGFLSFAKDRGLNVSGVVRGDPSEFHRRGWLRSDAQDRTGKPFFHPFRIYPFHQTLEATAPKVAPSVWLDRSSLPHLLERLPALLPDQEKLGAAAEYHNRIIDLAVLLEPIYWPRITERLRYPIDLDEHAQIDGLTEYRLRALELVRTLDVDAWVKAHERVRVDASWLDRNNDLYLLLRLSSWDQRKKLTGTVSAALWYRHLAEVIRLAFEEALGLEWEEEDRSLGTWHPGNRAIIFGSERPLDDEVRSKPYLAWRFGLFTGSAVRWYAEGDTEYAAIQAALPDTAREGVELVNLRGNIKDGRENVALKLRDCLLEDRAHRRFSILSFDTDVPENVKAIRRQIEAGHIVGHVGKQEPDFEFGNFTIEELAEVAARIDEAEGVSGDPVRQADWTGICSGRDFQMKYLRVSDRKPRELKGAVWGRALARFALAFPERADTGEERPFCRALTAAVMSRIASYDLQHSRFRYDPVTFDLIEISPETAPGF